MSRKKSGKPQRVELVLRRKNGRYVKNSRALSRYAAKQLRYAWEAQYDSGYYIEVRDADTHELVETDRPAGNADQAGDSTSTNGRRGGKHPRTA